MPARRARQCSSKVEVMNLSPTGVSGFLLNDMQSPTAITKTTKKK